MAVAGAGPNINADVMKNVSETENHAFVPGIRSGNRPATIASTASTNHSRGNGVDCRWTIDVPTTAAPSAVTSAT